MTFFPSAGRVDTDTARAILERNVMNSQRLISGEFESVLEDIIRQLEDPPVAHGEPVPVREMTKRIGSAIREGLIGLSPNGFEFCLWLWDAAPLHIVRMGTRPSEGEMHAAGVLQLRGVSAIVMRLYIAEQPQRLDSVIPLLDSSIDWIDARQLIGYAMLDHYLAHFEITYQHLLALARETKHWRAIIPLEVGKEMLAEKPEYTAMALAFLKATQHLHGNEAVAHSLLLFVRSAFHYGQPDAVAHYLSSHQEHAENPVIRAVCRGILQFRRAFPPVLHDALVPLLAAWQAAASEDVARIVRSAHTHLATSPANGHR